MTFICRKGATAYEIQIGRAYVYICYFRGAYWRFKPWRRFRFGWEQE